MENEQKLVNQQKKRKITDARDEPADAPLIYLSDRDRSQIEEAIDALKGLDLFHMPYEGWGDTIRGLLYALEVMVRVRIEPRCEDPARFNIRLTEEERILWRAAQEEVWTVSNSVLHGFLYLDPRRYLSERGDETPAHWSPGDFLTLGIRDAREALTRLEAVAQRLAQLDLCSP